VEGDAIAMKVNQWSLPGLLQRQASEQPDATAYTFIDYETDPMGFAESLTWSQVHRRSLVVAEELRRCGSIGDRAAILAPHGLDYIVAFLGALQAGFIAVPLLVPHLGVHNERVSSALVDCSPSVVLTTYSAVDEVAKYERNENVRSGTSVLEVDLLDLDSPRELDRIRYPHPSTAYLQYTSGSTRQPAGVVISHKNVVVNLRQAFSVYFEDSGNLPPRGLRFVSWLPFHHDMGLICSVCAPLLAGTPVVLLSPMSFLQRPARWMQLLANNGLSYSCAPNFGFDLAARRTSDEDMVGLDLGDVLGINSGAERVQPATIKQFNERFARFNLKDTVIRPSYGLAEATLFVAAPKRSRPDIFRFDYELMSSGRAKPCKDSDGTDLVSYGIPRACTVRIVDPETKVQTPLGTIGEIWVHGDNVAMGYWQKPGETERTFGAKIAGPSPGTPAGPWLRTGDLGVITDDGLFIVGRLKDLIVIDGRNHYPDDIEATVREITGGMVAAISLPDDHSEQLVAIAELNQQQSGSDAVRAQTLRSIKREITSAISTSHSLRTADVVLVPSGSIPATSSGKVRRSACIECYRQNEFKRLDVPADLLNETW
jgi:long chain fatty acid CoA FadD26